MEDLEKMRHKDNTHELSLQLISERELQGRISEKKELTGGYYGHVYWVKMEAPEASREVVIKLVRNEDEPVYEDEPIDNRVYGSRWSNLKPSHDLLVENNLPAPKLISIGKLEESDQQYAIMEFIDGRATKDLLLLSDTPAISQLHILVGNTLGKMHSIRRGFHGWVEMQEPYKKPWKEAFFESCQNQLERAAKHNQFVASNRDRIQDFILKNQEVWTGPSGFVFSHTDGFQGMAKYESNEWRLCGIIDVEDNQFTDQRFVLAGHELALEYSNKEALPEFWKAYKSHTEVDGSFESCKNLFKLYYVLCWTSVASEGWRGTAEEQSKAFGRLEELIGEYIS